MSRIIPVTRSSFLEVVLYVDENVFLLSRNNQPSCHKAAALYADGVFTTDALKAAFEQMEPEDPTGDFVNQLEIIKPGGFMNVIEAPPQDIFNIEVERQVPDRLND